LCVRGVDRSQQEGKGREYVSTPIQVPYSAGVLLRTPHVPQSKSSRHGGTGYCRQPSTAWHSLAGQLMVERVQGTVRNQQLETRIQKHSLGFGQILASCFRNPLMGVRETCGIGLFYRNCRSLSPETGWLGCWLHQCVLKKSLAGSKNVVSNCRIRTVEGIEASLPGKCVCVCVRERGGREGGRRSL
jgi:hypothetical protein